VIEKNWQQTVRETAKSTVELHSACYDIYVATDTGRQLWAVVCYWARLRKGDREKARDLCRDAQVSPQ
jgi:hypothetical protein